MTRNFRLQEKLFHVSDIRLWDIIVGLEKYDGKKSLLWMKIPLKYSLQIPFSQEKPFYGVRIIPYYRIDKFSTSIPTILFHWTINELTWEYLIQNKHTTIVANYNPLNPGYNIRIFQVTYDYIISILENIFLEVQVAQHLDNDPLAWVGEFYYNTEFEYSIWRDGMSATSLIKRNTQNYMVELNDLIFTDDINSFSRTQFFSVAYPVYRSLLVTSFVLSERGDESSKIPWISYDDSFYKKIWVPLTRSLGCILDISWWIKEKN